MKVHGKILVPTDCSTESSEAIRRAGVLAKMADAEVHVLHITSSPQYFETEMQLISPLEDVEDSIQLAALRQLKEQLKQFDFQITVHMKPSLGDSARNICKFAESLQADLIVIGRHDEKGVMKHMLRGSTVERVIAHSPCSVLVTLPHGIF